MNITTSASCSIAPDSRRSEFTGRLLGRCSRARFNCDSATTGHRNSLAIAFRFREISEISAVRPSAALDADLATLGVKYSPPSSVPKSTYGKRNSTVSSFIKSFPSAPKFWRSVKKLAPPNSSQLYYDALLGLVNLYYLGLPQLCNPT